MAATTTLKLPEELKFRIASVALASGRTPHAFMIEALDTQARLAEQRQAFINDALAAAVEIDAGGALYAMQDVHEYILARSAGKAVKRPKAVTQPHMAKPAQHKTAATKRSAG